MPGGGMGGPGGMPGGAAPAGAPAGATPAGAAPAGAPAGAAPAGATPAPVTPSAALLAAASASVLHTAACASLSWFSTSSSAKIVISTSFSAFSFHAREVDPTPVPAGAASSLPPCTFLAASSAAATSAVIVSGAFGAWSSGHASRRRVGAPSLSDRGGRVCGGEGVSGSGEPLKSLKLDLVDAIKSNCQG